jgi:DNA-binding NarL/FixJ family response regulator
VKGLQSHYPTGEMQPPRYTILSLFADGLTSKEIARALELSARTGDDHVDKTRMKMNASSRHKAGAIYRAFLASGESSALPEGAPYELRCEPPALDEMTTT